MKNRLKNYGLWVSVLAFIPMVLEAFGVNLLPDNYDEIVKSLLSILVLAGLISNPSTENHGYLDDEVTEEKKEIDEDTKE